MKKLTTLQKREQKDIRACEQAMKLHKKFHDGCSEACPALKKMEMDHKQHIAEFEAVKVKDKKK